MTARSAGGFESRSEHGCLSSSLRVVLFALEREEYTCPYFQNCGATSKITKERRESSYKIKTLLTLILHMWVVPGSNFGADTDFHCRVFVAAFLITFR
jgi:hypothetical protein